MVKSAAKKSGGGGKRVSQKSSAKRTASQKTTSKSASSTSSSFSTQALLKKSPQVPQKPIPEDKVLLYSTARKISEFLDFEAGKKFAIISDNDEDGVTAAVQLRLFLESQKMQATIFFYDHFSRQFSFPRQFFTQFAAEKTIFLDLADGFVTDIVSEMGNAIGPFLVVDHHQREVVHGNAFKSMVIKPGSFSEIEPSKYPTSRMVFDLFGGRDWLCAIGVIGDYAHEQWKDFLKSVQDKYDLTPKKLHELAEIIACITSQYPEKINSLADFLVSAKGPKDLLDSEYVALKKLFYARLKVLEEVFDKEAERYEEEGIYFFKSDNRFASKLSTILSEKHQDKVLMIYEQPADGNVKFSIRRQDFKVDCGALARAAIMGIPEAKGGGHLPAAGASVPAIFVERFKKQARLYLLQHPPNEVLKTLKNA